MIQTRRTHNIKRNTIEIKIRGCNKHYHYGKRNLGDSRRPSLW
jgi:hypothetical protein